MKRFPMRTLVLMVLALFSFAWFWWQMHRPRPAAAPRLDVRIVPTPPDAAGHP